MTSSESEEHAQQSRKRSRTSNSGDNGAGKKTRGRPRVDTHDATAADRRRTQIRLAQRAYRQRKETTIASLKTQTTQLHSIIEQMNNNFHRLTESTLRSGLLQLNPDLAQEFKLVKETFSSLARTASESQRQVDEDVEQGAEGASSRKPPEPEPEPEHVGWGYFAVSQPHNKDQAAQNLPVPNGYSSQFSATGGDQSAPSIISHSQYAYGEQSGQTHHVSQPVFESLPAGIAPQQELPFGLIPVPDQQQTPYETSNFHTNPANPANVPAPGLAPATASLPTTSLSTSDLSMKTLSPVWSYNHNESTVGRRLARSTVESGFAVLTHLNYSPAIINHIFRLNFPHYNVEQIKQRFQQVMSRTVVEDLDWFEAPFAPLGGAGTHYPRRDAAGNVVPRNFWGQEWIGPREKSLEGWGNVEGRAAQYLSTVDLSGFEGEWFDAHDVQGYLEEHYACKFNPSSSFAECLIDIEDKGPTNSYANVPQQAQTNRGATANNGFGMDTSFGGTPAPEYAGDFTQLVNHDISFDQTLGLDLAPGFDYGFTNNTSFGTGPGIRAMGDDLEGLQVVKQRKRCAWIDVSRLIFEIVQSAVCLGRTPGFRRKDVDRAVHEALIKEI
ncbi:hypothetical protein COCC4DRAFT_73197 [Bipolaris maydis ATCC 48331]|uniref:BZIP domain-containing protein n=2 Tax=Cochliobolus heterostrophus TaxID=5016 RepID=M2TYJ0_COCH5|nr:uncharacterized protein COCC4DRAFT_73197 [Bipolaris maydis ATCC 48331]EMD86891.1 hypothetical protein COCHEDRAFT_1145758 [Bipolaris maydis C5]KAJ5046243.1 hypothetical protein J3E74DRAFT_31895 [Bipolaris maydis]ENI04112.1 hypothetical protein COCC4DRAFT_73197 [Bipolaris maydis ATCC 48331]KAJ5055588.1 hypothetical protein J3E74DRAFT_17954 [Bipolaris maydis]KAJ6193036.1 hypothetical protein J3E72DRAFT_407731 [Bipolaris maydis]